MTLIKNQHDRQFRVWLSKLDSQKCGEGFYRFYALRECLESISGSCSAHIERMETYALQGRFDLVEQESLEFLEGLPSKKEHFLNMIAGEK
jgi:hypothetical protein